MPFSIYTHAYHHDIRIVFFIFLLLSTTSTVADSLQKQDGQTLQQVVVIHRHGARRALVKNEFDPSLETINAEQTDILFPSGEQQLQALGSYIRQTYLSEFTTTISPYKVLSYSSDFRRTISSSRFFLSGLFPTSSSSSSSSSSDTNAQSHTHIPTLIYNQSIYDYFIRGYAVCPQLTRNFMAFTKTEAYAQKKKQYESTIRDIAQAFSMSNTNFENVFNIYDQYIRQRYTNDSNEYEPSQTEINTLIEAADWYESSKFHYAIHKQQLTVAHALLKQIVKNFQSFTYTEDNENINENNIQIFELSAHYPTLLTLLSSIRNDLYDDSIVEPANQIPPFGAAIIIEMYQKGDDQGGRTLRFKWYKGDKINVDDIDSNADIMNIDVAKRQRGCADNECPLSAFTDDADLMSFNEETFCKQCQPNDANESSTSTSKFCNLIENDFNCSSKSSSSSNRLYTAIGILIGIVLCVFAYCLVTFFSRRNRAKSMIQQDDMINNSNNDIRRDTSDEIFDDQVNNLRL